MLSFLDKFLTPFKDSLIRTKETVQPLFVDVGKFIYKGAEYIDKTAREIFPGGYNLAEGGFSKWYSEMQNPESQANKNLAEALRLESKMLYKGQHILDANTGEWIITEVLGDGKFKAVPKDYYDTLKGNKYPKDTEKALLDKNAEQFDISGKLDTNNPIYKFYENTLGKYLQNKYKARRIIDRKGVSWYELDVPKKQLNYQ